MSERTRKKAAIRRATQAARRQLEELDTTSARELIALYAGAVTDLGSILTDYADDHGVLTAEVLIHLMDRLTQRMEDLAQGRDAMLTDRLQAAARTGAQVYTAAQADIGTDLLEIAEQAVRQVRSYVAEDGLQLSDRIWRLNRQNKRILEEQVEAVILQGRSASQAAADLASSGEDLPKRLRDKITEASPGRIKRGLREALLQDDSSAHANALRLFRTEINRAHGEAHRAAMERHPDIVGERFELSPAHPRPDICDHHARANLHGMGLGVYPVGRSPWPAHPNTLSYITPVFADEITDEDRQGKEDLIEALRRRPTGELHQILGKHKTAALRAGLLKSSQINTPWRVLKRRYQRQGIDIEDL